MCCNQTAMATEPSAHVPNPNGHHAPCWYNSTSNSTSNMTHILFTPQEDVTSISYVLLFSALFFLIAVLYCLALRAGMVNSSIRHGRAVAMTRTDTSSFDAMTLKERRQYIDKVLNVKVKAITVSGRLMTRRNITDTIICGP
jgi:hypothetical protein